MDSQRRLGILLVAAGLVALGLQFAGGAAWPWFVLAPGLVLLALAWSRVETDVALPGALLTTIGAILLVQDATDTFHTWSYAWALVVAAAGAGRLLRGRLQGVPEDREGGRDALTTGLVLFAAFGLFFEFVVFRDDLSQVAAWGVPALLILAGLYLAWRQQRPDSTHLE